MKKIKNIKISFIWYFIMIINYISVVYSLILGDYKKYCSYGNETRLPYCVENNFRNKVELMDNITKYIVIFSIFMLILIIYFVYKQRKIILMKIKNHIDIVKNIFKKIIIWGFPILIIVQLNTFQALCFACTSRLHKPDVFDILFNIIFVLWIFSLVYWVVLKVVESILKKHIRNN